MTPSQNVRSLQGTRALVVSHTTDDCRTDGSHSSQEDSKAHETTGAYKHTVSPRPHGNGATAVDTHQWMIEGRQGRECPC